MSPRSVVSLAENLDSQNAKGLRTKTDNGLCFVTADGVTLAYQKIGSGASSLVYAAHRYSFGESEKVDRVVNALLQENLSPNPERAGQVVRKRDFGDDPDDEGYTSTQIVEGSQSPVAKKKLKFA